MQYRVFPTSDRLNYIQENISIVEAGEGFIHAMAIHFHLDMNLPLDVARSFLF